MKAIVITAAGGYDVLQVQEFPDPQPSAGEIRIKVQAAGLNFAEVMARQGTYPDAPPTPSIVGYEASGIVDKVGENVSSFKEGDRVLVMKKFGCHAEMVVVPENQAFHMPESMSFEEAAALPVVYLTAYHSIFRVGNLRPRESILVHAAAGGVGTAAIQLARTIPNVKIFGTASASKHDTIKKEGCDYPIDYHTQDFASEVMRITEGKGVNLILDAQGGESLAKGYEILRKPGRLVFFGLAAAISGETRSLVSLALGWWKTPSFSAFRLINENRSVAGVNMAHFFDEVEYMQEEIQDILRLYNEGAVRPIIDSKFAFSEAKEGHRRIIERKNVGKVLLVPDDIFNASQ
eukprot:TRINITY_DN6785_c0_g1_i1.p1 TRINITY_DN6785_c0_g1~~TRINITY_DN6785_c0_g1_i1.p1  ORF type:complete len:348 (-),score=83.60 TRINITY_DN6785_c0_g1_i1:140-1183(-)